MKLVSIDSAPGPSTGVVIGDEILDFARAVDVLPMAGWVPHAMPALLAGGEAGLDVIRRLIDAVDNDQAEARARLRRALALRPINEVRLAPAIPRPGILLAHGRSYHSHMDEMAGASDIKIVLPTEPKGFIKNPHSIIAHNQPIVLPAHCPDMVDFEGEFSVVIGADCYNVTPEEVPALIAGYTIVHDVGARDWVKTNDWDLNRMGKQLRTFSPLGPWIVTKDEIPDPHNLNLTTKLNGEVMQSANTSDLIWKIPQIVSFFSGFYPFRAGDVITTGSPAGVGFARNPQVFLKEGDVVEITVDGVGTLSNPVISADKA